MGFLSCFDEMSAGFLSFSTLFFFLVGWEFTNCSEKNYERTAAAFTAATTLGAACLDSAGAGVCSNGCFFL